MAERLPQPRHRRGIMLYIPASPNSGTALDHPWSAQVTLAEHRSSPLQRSVPPELPQCELGWGWSEADDHGERFFYVVVFTEDKLAGMDSLGKAVGGGRGIRTPGTLAGTTVFKTAGINRSPIPPRGVGLYSIVRRNRKLPAGFAEAGARGSVAKGGTARTRQLLWGVAGADSQPAKLLKSRRLCGEECYNRGAWPSE